MGEVHGAGYRPHPRRPEPFNDLSLLPGIRQPPFPGWECFYMLSPSLAPALPLRVLKTKPRYLLPFPSFFKFGQFLIWKQMVRKNVGITPEQT